VFPGASGNRQYFVIDDD